MGVLVDNKLFVSQQCPCGQEDQRILECIRIGCQEVRGGDLSLCSALVRPHLELYVQF